MLEHIDIMQVFFDKGGPVLAAIFYLSLLLWILIIERYHFLLRIHPASLEKTLGEWRRCKTTSSWHTLKIRNGFLADLSIALRSNLAFIDVLTGVLPLLGLLGTVTGMIALFEILNVFGTGNVRGMANGISRALLPTTAGLVTSIIGIYFSADIKKRIKRSELHAKDLLAG